MDKPKEQLLAQLNDLHTTMLGVHKRDEQLNMCAWLTKLYDAEEDTFCGYAACVCGWQSLGNLDNFPTAKDWAEGWREAAADSKYPEGTARRVSNDLDNTCYGVFGYSHLVESIYDGYTQGRLGNAEDSGLFSKEELTHPHLTKDNPTALEAANYAVLCIEKVKAHD